MVDFPRYKMLIFHRYMKIPEGNGVWSGFVLISSTWACIVPSLAWRPGWFISQNHVAYRRIKWYDLGILSAGRAGDVSPDCDLGCGRSTRRSSCYQGVPGLIRRRKLMNFSWEYMAPWRYNKEEQDTSKDQRYTYTGWWFETCLIFPYIGNHPNWLSYISDG